MFPPMSLAGKISQRSRDPVFYRKLARAGLRPLKKFADAPRTLEPEDWNLKRAVCVVAHPDDETFCSGLLIRLARAGVETRVICLTRGEGGPAGNHPREELGEIREKEMRRACLSLGIENVEFLGYVDPVARRYRVYAPQVSVLELSERLGTFFAEGDLIICHGSNGEYWHPAHLLVFDAVKRVVTRERSFDSLRWLTFLARQPDHPLPKMVNWDDEATYRLDAADLAEDRLKALSCHSSQLDLFARFADGHYSDFIRKTSQECYRLRTTSQL